MAAHASNNNSCVNGLTSTNSESDRNSNVGEGELTELNVTDIDVVLKVKDPILLWERNRSLDDHSGLKSNENMDSKVDVVYDFGLHSTLPNIQNEEMEPPLIIPDLLPGRIQLVDEMQSELEPDEYGYEPVDSKVFCDTLPNVSDEETKPQFKVLEVFPVTTPLTFDQVNSGLETDANSFEEEDSKISVVCDSVDDTKPNVHDVGIESQQIDPDALRGRMQRMVDKIHSGLAVLCSGPLSTQTPQTSINRPLQVSSECTNRNWESSELGKNTRFHCLKCSEVFKDQSDFEDHQKSHRRKELHLCPYCQRVFNHTFKLRDHMAIHTGKVSEYCKVDHRLKKCYICPYCRRSFRGVVKLRDHISKHTGKKPFHCDLCGAGFRRNASLQNHKRVHSRERKFKCIQCGKKFKYSSGLCKHRRVCRSCPEVE